MAKKVLLLVALVCMVVPFMVAGYCASAEEVTPRIIYNVEIRISGIDWSKIEDFTLLVVDRVNGYSELFSYDEGDFTFGGTDVASVAVEEPDLLSGNTWLCFGVDVLDRYNPSTFKLLGIASFDAGVETDGVGSSDVNMVKIPSSFEDFEYIRCNFTYLDLASASSDAYNSGYNVGYTAGQNNANANINYDSASYQQGKLDGIATANNYTFLDLMGAVFDAPIRALFGYVENGVRVDGLFTLDILGVNLSSFLLSIFTLGIVITIVRLCLGGK